MACTASLDKIKEFSSYAMEGFNSGDIVVVIGSGPLGLLHIAKADMMGAGRIIATDLSPYRLDWARRCGADEVIDVSTTTSEERIERVREATGGRGADRYPFDEMVTQEFGLADVETAMRTSMSVDSDVGHYRSWAGRRPLRSATQSPHQHHEEDAT